MVAQEGSTIRSSGYVMQEEELPRSPEAPLLPSPSPAPPPDATSLHQEPPTEQLKIASGLLMAHACRFSAGSDFASSLRQMADVTGAHCILSIVGSLSSVTLRMPQHRTDARVPLFQFQDVPLEIVSATGTFARMGTSDDDSNDEDKDKHHDDTDGGGRPRTSGSTINFHIHLSVSDSSGHVYGGHLIDGTVRTTAEVVLGSLQNVHFSRAMDPATGFDELVVAEEEGD